MGNTLVSVLQRLYVDCVITALTVYVKETKYWCVLLLAMFLLYRKKIQNGVDGHCSIEDAKTCMELVQLKIQNGTLVNFHVSGN